MDISVQPEFLNGNWYVNIKDTYSDKGSFTLEPEVALALALEILKVYGDAKLRQSREHKPVSR